MVVVVVVVLVVVQALRSIPAQTAVGRPPAPLAVPGTAALPWPAGAAGAVAVGPSGPVRTSGPSAERPIASLAKMMTAYVVLADHPLASGQSGPSITITTADVATYQADVAASDSVVQVAAGEALTEQQAIEALLVGSADNIADVLADWDASSESAFVAEMNTTARSLGMDHTHYTDPSGLATTTVSTPSDQLVITRKAMAVPAFAAAVGLAAVTLPVAGAVQNYDYDVGHTGVVGVKTGSDSAAGGCWAFAAKRTIAGATQTVFGVVLGVPGTAAGLIEPALSAGVALADAVGSTVRSMTVLPAGSVVGYVDAPWRSSPVPLTTVRAVHGLVENGARVAFHVVVVPPTGRTLARGERLGSVSATGVFGVDGSPVVAGGAGAGPTLGWRLTRL